MGRIGATCLVGAVIGAVAGCAGQSLGLGGPGVDRLGGAPEVRPSWTSCEKEAPDPLRAVPGAASPGAASPGAASPDAASPDRGDPAVLPRLGDGFTPVAAVICAQTFERRPDGGEDMVAIESRADDIAALVKTLRLPDEPRTDRPCTADLVIPPWLALLDGQGRWVRPGVPYDECGKPRIEFRNAVDALTLKRVSTRPIKETESAEAATAGCAQSWADMVWVEASGGFLDPAARVESLPAPSARMRLCAYRVPVGEQGGGKPAGDFAYGGPLAPDRWADVERSIRNAGPAKRCTTPASRFAVLMPVAGGQEVYVELAGCHRILATSVSGGAALRQADDALVDLLGQSASRR
jgi:hypothetical protein